MRLFQRFRLFNLPRRTIGSIRNTRRLHQSFNQYTSDYTSLLLEKNLAHKNSSTEDTSLICTMFDKNGNLNLRSSEVKRTDLINKYGLFARDLRKIENVNSHTEIAPSISVRKRSIVVNLCNIRALIQHETVILFDDLTSRSSHSQNQFLADLETRLKYKSSELPYEIRALESMLISTVTNLHAEMKVHTTITKGILQELEDNISRDKLRFLLIQNKKITTFAQRATLIRNVIDELLDNDDDLAGMYLTEKFKGTPRSMDDHEEVEMLLESYYKHFDEIVQTINNAISNIKTTEEIINIILDSNRNQLMLLGLRFSIGLLTMGSGLFIAAAYGMNVENFIETGDVGFVAVVVCSTVVMISLFFYSIKHLNKLQKVTLMGEHYRTSLKENHINRL